MKLYATVTSERASKGQGGNEYINFVLRNETQEVILTLQVKQTPYIDYEVEILKFLPTNKMMVQVLEDKQLQTKGEKQTGEVCGMKNCNNVAEFNELCDYHYRNNRNV